MRRPSRFQATASAVAGLALAALSACTVGPDYQRPAQDDTPAAFKELAGWKTVQPQQVDSQAPWWAIFADPVLDDLEQRVDVSNQSLKASEAAYRQTVAALDAAKASFFPTLGVNSSATRTRSVAARASGGNAEIANSFGLSLVASWIPDLWGKVRRAVEGAEATAQASAADLAAARLSAQGSLASDYFTLRAYDELQRLLTASAEAYAQSLRITTNQYKAGMAAASDVAQAEAQLKATQALAIAAGSQRAQMEHAIALLIGLPAAAFSLPPVENLAAPPTVPVGLPSALLERRPDIAGAERRMAAATAEIGVAEAAWYPQLTLGGSFGASSATLGNLLQASNTVWSLGPQLSATLFDGGLRSAQLAEAQASLDQEVATYRQTVLTAFQQVEDQLAILRILDDQVRVQNQAVVAAERAERLILNQYKAGTVSYTSVVTAQTAALSDKQTALTLRQNRLTASVALVQALGGGWQGALPKL